MRRAPGAGARRVEHDEVRAQRRAPPSVAGVDPAAPHRGPAAGRRGSPPRRPRPCASDSMPDDPPGRADRVGERRRSAGRRRRTGRAPSRPAAARPRRAARRRRSSSAAGCTCQNPAAATSNSRAPSRCRSRCGPVDDLDPVRRAAPARLPAGSGRCASTLTAPSSPRTASTPVAPGRRASARVGDLGRAERAVPHRLEVVRAVPVQPGRPVGADRVGDPGAPAEQAAGQLLDRRRGRGRRRPAGANCSRTTAALSARCAGADACCQSQPPHRPGPACGHGGGDPVGRRRRAPRRRRRGRTSRRRPRSPRARTRSPGSACRTNTTRPSARATQKPPCPGGPISSSSSAARPVGSHGSVVAGPGADLVPRHGAAGPSGRDSTRSCAAELESSCHGTLVTITPGWNSSRPLSRSADWLCSSCSHQCPTTYSGMNTLTTSRGRSSRS